MRRAIVATLLSLAVLGLLQLAGTPKASALTCPSGWGSLARQDPTMSSGTLQAVRAGRHDCFDRLVVDVAGPVPGYAASYVGQVTEDGSGRVVPVRGGAKIELVVRAPAHDGAGNPTYRPANRSELVDVSGYRTFRQVAWAGSFEGQTTLGLGVRARLPFRVFTLRRSATSSAVVIDVAHSW